VGIGIGDDPEAICEWIDKGVNWVSMGGDFTLLVRATKQVISRVRERAR
jgi:hypothetical protein